VHPIDLAAFWPGYDVIACSLSANDTLLIELEPQAGSVPKCGRCGQSSPLIHERRIRQVRDRDLLDQRVLLQLPVRRVDCLSCGRVYEHTSVIITTNLSFAEWSSVFGDAKMTTSAAGSADAPLPHRRTPPTASCGGVASTGSKDIVLRIHDIGALALPCLDLGVLPCSPTVESRRYRLAYIADAAVPPRLLPALGEGGCDSTWYGWSGLEPQQ
jgi:hypothetical protein